MGFDKNRQLAIIYSLFDKLQQGRSISQDKLNVIERKYLNGLVSSSEQYVFEDGFYKKIAIPSS